MATQGKKTKYSKFDPVDINIGLEVLYPNAEELFSRAPSKNTLEIVAIPGLGANPEWTWVREKVHWLRDSNMLARKVPNSRISVFQYQSQWFGKGSVDQRLENVANQLLYALDRFRGNDNKTPIIFVCHCLGGIVLEKALLTARLRQNDFPSIYPYVAGCIFLGTPFHGTTTQSKAMILAQMAETIGMGVPSHLLKLLEKDSEMLTSLLEDFALLAKDAQIRLFCFFEQQKSDITATLAKGLPFKKQELVVDEASATITAVEKLPLASDHFRLNKYTGPKDGNFVAVSNEIKITAQKAAGILKSRQNALRQLLVSDRTYHSIMDNLGKGFQDVDACIKGSYKTTKVSTPSWVLDVEKYKSWKIQQPQILWVHGKAGAGQGAIATSVLDSLTQTREQGSIIASFFCDQGDESRRTFRGLLKLLLRQIIDIDQDLAVHLLVDSRKAHKAVAQDFDAESLSKVAVLWDALLAMAGDLPGGNIYIVVYGLEQLAKESLDEFLGYVKELDQLQSAQDEDAPPIKWMFLSRSGRPDIEKALKGRALEINTDDSENRAYISDTLRTDISVLVDELDLPAPLAYFVKRYIHARAEDNYIYVNLAIQEVKNAYASGQTEHAEIRKLLESFPYGLTDMFEHIRKRVLKPHSEGIEYTKEILRCLVLAHVAPTMRELAVMAGLPKEHQNDLEILKGYMVKCGAFITLRGNDWDEENKTVEWIDISAREHLEKYAKDDLAVSLNDMQHGIIALRCLGYLYDTIDIESISSMESNNRLGIDIEDMAVGVAEVKEQELDVEVKLNAGEAYNNGQHLSASPSEASDDEDDEDDGDGIDDNDEVDNEAGDDAEDEEDGEDESDEEDEESDSNNKDDDQHGDSFSSALKYPLFHWIKHAKLAPIDVLEEFRTGHAFWQDYSEPRQAWWRLMESMHPLPGQTDVSALHIAVIAGFPALVDHLLNHGWTQDIHSEDSLGFQPLYYACGGGEYEIVQMLLGAGADIIVSEEGKVSALHAAASNGHLDIVECLLDRGADINTTSEQHGTALYAASENGHMAIMKLLINHGAEVNIPGGSGRRALNVAAYMGHFEGVKLLIENGADIDPDEEYWYGSAVGAAARNGHADIMKLLLSNGWSPDKPMNTYGSFITAAATYNHLNVVELLIRKETRIPVLEHALQAAAQRGYLRIVECILKKTPTLRHQKAFHLAAFYGRNEVLKVLFPRGVSQDKLDEALFHATDNEHEETVNLLLEFGADPNAEGPIYGCALIASAYDGTEGILQALLENGADVNKRGGEYGTAIQAAALYGDVDNVRMLIEHRAILNTEQIGVYGNELQAATYTGDEDTIRLLLEHGANVNARGGKYGYPIIAAVSEGDSKALRLLIENQADVNVRGSDNNSPVITLAAGTLLKEDLELILEKGADINAADDQGATALICCADAYDTEGLQFLLDHGADVHICSPKFGTALHVAAAEGDEESCEILLKAGADVNAIGGWNGTPLQAAAYCDDMDCVDLLLKANADATGAKYISGEFGTPLQAASVAGATNIVRKLIEHGAVVNPKSPNGEFGCALSAASAMSEEKTVRLLLKHKADVNFEGGKYGLPVLAAAQAGNLKIVKLLLDRNAVVTSQSGLFGSAIAAAAFGNNQDIVELVLDQGADVHAKGGKYGSAIQAAAVHADMEIIDVLLSHDVDVNCAGGKYHTALIASSYFNRLDLVEKLLDRGADFKLQGGKYRSAVTAAAIRGNHDILERLLEMELPQDMLDEALVEACAHRESTCVEMLLKAGASVYARHPELGLPGDALRAEKADGYNSDDEQEEDGDDEEEEDSDDDSDDDEEDDDNEQSDDESESEEDASNDGTVTEQTAEGSVTDLQLEEHVSEEIKIQKLLEDAMERVKRTASVRRTKSVKGSAKVPPAANSNHPPQIPPTTSIHQFDAPMEKDSPIQAPTHSEDKALQEPPDQKDHEPSKDSTERESQSKIQHSLLLEKGHSPLPSPALPLPNSNAASHSTSSQPEHEEPQERSVQAVPSRSESSTDDESHAETQTSVISQKHQPPLAFPPPPSQLSKSPSSKKLSQPEIIATVTQSPQPTPKTTPSIELPTNDGSSPQISPGLPAKLNAPQKFSTKVPNRKPLRSPGLTGTFSLTPSPGHSRPSSSHSNYTTPPSSQNILPQQVPERKPSPSQYQAYSTPPPAQNATYVAYNQSSQASSRTSSFRSSQYHPNTMQGSSQEYVPYRTSNSSQTSITGSQHQAPEKKWSTGGYDGEGYG